MADLSGSTNIVQNYQELLWQKFPNVVLIEDRDCPEDIPILDIFFVPDERMNEFDDFWFNDVLPRALDIGHPWVLSIPHSISHTSQYYPEVFKRFGKLKG